MKNKNYKKQSCGKLAEETETLERVRNKMRMIPQNWSWGKEHVELEKEQNENDSFKKSGRQKDKNSWLLDKLALNTSIRYKVFAITNKMAFYLHVFLFHKVE